MFNSIEELVASARENKVPLWQVMVSQEAEAAGCSEEEIIRDMDANFQVMKEAVREGIRG